MAGWCTSAQSQYVSPSVRLGFAVVPQPLAEPIAALRQLIDWHPPIAMQTAMAGFINDGLLDKHIRRSRRVYAVRHHILTEALFGPLACRPHRPLFQRRTARRCRATGRA